MKKRLFSVIYMFLITLVFTSMVSAVKLLNEDRIQTNQRVKFQKIVLKVLNMPLKTDATDEDLERIFETRVRSIQVKGKMLYMGYKDEGQTIKGYAFPVGGPGFWGPIYGMVGVNAEIIKVLGIAFYRHAETPGLGGRITEEWFQDQFIGLSLPQMDEEGKIFYFKSGDARKASNELDAITGATETSRAVESFLNRELGRFVKDLRQYIKKGNNRDA